MDQKQKVLNFMKTQSEIVIASVNSDNNPEAALIGFGEMDDLSFIFGTSNLSRKYKNITANPKVAVVIGNDELIEIQYEGIASILEGEELVTYKKVYYTKAPGAKKFENNPDQVYFKVIPKWIRYTDYNSSPSEIFKLSL